MKSEYYYLRCDLSDKFPFSITRVELNGADSMLVYGLKRINKWDERIRFYYSEYSTPADFEIPMVCPLHYATKFFIDALDADLLNYFNFIPVEINPEKDGPIIKDYYIVDYVYTLATLDMNLSEVVYDQERPDEIMTVPHCVLDKSKIPSNIQAFRLQESPTNVIISKQVMDNLNKNSVTGTRFVPVEMNQ